MSSTNETDTEQSIKTTQTKKVGRPRKKDLESNTKGNRGKVGRPKGDAAKMNEYKAMMLTSPKSELIIAKIADAALDDDHKNQSAAWKLWMDRMLPVSMFDKDAGRGGGGVKIHVEVVGGDATVNVGDDDEVEPEEAIDGEFEEVQED